MESTVTKVRENVFVGLQVGEDLSSNNLEIIVKCFHFVLSGSKGRIARVGLSLIQLSM